MIKMHYADLQGDQISVDQEDLEGALVSAHSALRMGAKAVSIETETFRAWIAHVERLKGGNQ